MTKSRYINGNRHRVIIIACVCAGLTWLSCVESRLCGSDIGQKRTTDKTNSRGTVYLYPDRETVAKILDSGFSYDYGNPRTTKCVVMMRFEPSFHPESQVVIWYGRDSPVKVEVWQAAVQLDKVLEEHFAQTRSPDISKVVSMMKIAHKSWDVGGERGKEMSDSMWRALAESVPRIEKVGVDNMVQLDGTRYILEYKDGMSRLSLDILGSEIESENADRKDDLPVVKWMKELRGGIGGMVR